MSAQACLLFAVLVDVVTSLWVYLGRDWSFQILANAMYLPGVMSLAFVDNVGAFLLQITGAHSVYTSILYSAVAVVLTYLIVYGCVALGVGVGWTKKAHYKPSAVHAHQPGIAWGFFHVAVMVLLTHKLKPEHPVRTIIVQCLSCVISAFPHGWLAVKAGYSIWPSAVMHFWWNRINPQVLGSIYTNTPGTYCGSQWRINGEGLVGCVVMVPVAILVSWELNNALF